MSAKEAKEKLQGVVIAAQTPFKEDFSLDLDGVRECTRFLVESGMRNGTGTLLSTGAGGEYVHLSIEERKRVTEAAVEAANGEIPVFVGGTHTSTLHAVELAKFANETGADGLQVSPPHYFVHSEEEIYQYFKALNDAIDIGIVVYNDPWACGVDIGVELLERLAGLENIIGLKWSTDDPLKYVEVYELFSERFSIIDNQLIATGGLGFMCGARGYISQVANFAPKYELKILRLLRAGEYAKVHEELLKLALPYYRLLRDAHKEGITGEGNFMKAAVEVIGKPTGPPRPPHLSLPRKYKERMREILLNSGEI